MTQVVRRHWRAGIVVAAAVVTLVTVLPLIAERGPASRERVVVLIARGMTFELEAEPAVANPVIRLTAGERVRVVVRNETPGIQHDLAVPAWDIETRLLSTNEEMSLTLTVPEAPGTVEYLCRPHSQMMRGTIEVVAR